MHEGLGLEKGLGLGNMYGLELEMRIVRCTCELRADGLGLGKVRHEGLGLEIGLETGKMTGGPRDVHNGWGNKRQKKRLRD